MNLVLILYFASVLVTVVAIREPCIAEKFGSGVVKYYRDCEFAISLQKLKKISDFKLLIKGYGKEGIKQLVCCPIRPAEKACRDFGEKPEEPVDYNNDYDEDDPLVDRIINGDEAYVGEFPHFAALAYISLDNGQLSFECGGALISRDFVLTAAHCCSKVQRMPILVRLGKTSLDSDDKKDPHEKVDIDIINTIRHPSYNISRKYYDIALIELKHPAPFSFRVWPACLAPDSPVKANSKFLIAGFGRNEISDSTKQSKWMLKAWVQEYNLTECKTLYQKRYGKGNNLKGLEAGITSGLVCANNRKKHVDTCQGDSGSALQILSDEVYYVYGVTSFGVSCNTDLPSFYTRVSSNLYWIEKIVWP